MITNKINNTKTIAADDTLFPIIDSSFFMTHIILWERTYFGATSFGNFFA